MDEVTRIGEITEQLREWSGRQGQTDDGSLFLSIYQELRRRAHYLLQSERRGHTLQTTALVNEAYLRIKEQQKFSWESRTHFFAIAAAMMRRILVDYAKHRQRVKRGGKDSPVMLDESLNVAIDSADVDLLALDEALDRLWAKEKQLAKVVELRYFAGLDVPQTAEVLGVSESTVKRQWAMAKAWLHRELTRT
jgi:RNA polymerase sigma factor (TIGR02999 family)